jgi:hypothetical protein
MARVDARELAAFYAVADPAAAAATFDHVVHGQAGYITLAAKTSVRLRRRPPARFLTRPRVSPEAELDALGEGTPKRCSYGD